MSDHTIGRITFGPKQTPEEALRSRELSESLTWSIQGNPLSTARPCNCMGPQPGETKCPCALAAEMQKGAAMIRDGVVIGGVEYELVPKGKTRRVSDSQTKDAATMAHELAALLEPIKDHGTEIDTRGGTARKSDNQIAKEDA